MLKEEAVFRPPNNMAENTVKDKQCHCYQNLVQNMVCVHNIVFVKGHNAGMGAWGFPKVEESLQKVDVRRVT